MLKYKPGHPLVLRCSTQRATIQPLLMAQVVAIHAVVVVVVVVNVAAGSDSNQEVKTGGTCSHIQLLAQRCETPTAVATIRFSKRQRLAI